MVGITVAQGLLLLYPSRAIRSVRSWEYGGIGIPEPYVRAYGSIRLRLLNGYLVAVIYRLQRGQLRKSFIQGNLSILIYGAH
jgi:hypothetical protein